MVVCQVTEVKSVFIFSAPHVFPWCPERSLKSHVGCREMRRLGSERRDSVSKKAGHWKRQEEFAMAAEHKNCWAAVGQCTESSLHCIQLLVFSCVSVSPYFPGSPDIKKSWVLHAHARHFFLVPGFLL